ncbi:hypothetical protein [Leptospira ilyithenensis]|uniref:Uncharacterized protein n=1 Tax=Leptospira ilyithenensis TaxID=2484901 RepID=A0A4R9LS29_9LEPT|nr:hypothetical protein [Leptospira ilyithenensis]TGN09696.1 hypothetical protein EHS11_11450 [Leptospira ilyithenensis]
MTFLRRLTILTAIMTACSFFLSGLVAYYILLKDSVLREECFARNESDINCNLIGEWSFIAIPMMVLIANWISGLIISFVAYFLLPQNAKQHFYTSLIAVLLHPLLVFIICMPIISLL